jgi:steroid 5-alpha reductase family enzyme
MKATDNRAVLSSGLWAWSRHPNYLGEITFWTGLFIMALGASWFNWWTVIGLAGMVLLFTKVSIPMMEERQMERKPGYSEYKQRTSVLFPKIYK